MTPKNEERIRVLSQLIASKKSDLELPLSRRAPTLKITFRSRAECCTLGNGHRVQL